ncbi:VOC family protein [Lactococcus garvieae]
MNKVIHFEIHVEDMERAKEFYATVFNWQYQDWSEYAGMPYFGVTTGDNSASGIDGAMMQRQGLSPEETQPISGFVCTIGVENYNCVEEKILAAGGKIAMPKYGLTGMAWQGYYKYTENNIFGIHQPDENAK